MSLEGKKNLSFVSLTIQVFVLRIDSMLFKLCLSENNLGGKSTFKSLHPIV